MMDPGSLDQRITFKEKQVTRNGMGEEVVAWVDVATVWAEAIPTRGREFFAAAQMQQTVDVRFRIRERSGLRGDMKLTWRGADYDITAIIPGTGKYAGALEIMAVHGVRNG